MLKFPFTLHDVCDINFVVITYFTGTLHNMLFDYDDQFRDPVRDEFSTNHILLGQRQVIRVTMTRDRKDVKPHHLECVCLNIMTATKNDDTFTL